MPVANFERREFSFRFSLLFYQVPVIPAKPSAWTGPRNMTFCAEGVSTDTRGGINLTFGEPSNCSRPQRMSVARDGVIVTGPWFARSSAPMGVCMVGFHPFCE